jgi:magnesium transporter
MPRKKRNHRGGKKKRARKQSFAASTEGSGMGEETSQSIRQAQSHSAARASFYRLQGRHASNTSIESEALLDHRYFLAFASLCSMKVSSSIVIQRSTEFET